MVPMSIVYLTECTDTRTKVSDFYFVLDLCFMPAAKREVRLYVRPCVILCSTVLVSATPPTVFDGGV